MAELDGKVALITGAARNIGRAIALELAAGGAAVMGVALSDEAGLGEMAAAVEAEGGKAAWQLADVTKPDSVRAAVAATLERFGRIDILVNNAAIRGEVAFDEMTLAQWHQVLGVTLDGPFLCSQAALEALTASGAGAIINIGGLTAYTGAKQRAHVVTAKAGLDGLTKALAQELAERQITVNLVSPGLIDTVRGGHSAAQPDHHKHRTTLLGRRGRPQEVAAMVRYLAGPNGRYLTGQTMHVNGGAYLP
ncbi:SDR family NAD(P)-dependent oxidoreductase [Bosea caraganae]|uniref:SDR family NAD(P)-dependent oxidoreductase n=1 Tax=Bosea caraganae TaxID=2763117 RepID=A0A370LA96_9HYPH|nr:SDR family oxidoreductase [Bosea caraganae]RDJ21830.1 SDR family NAD(P)-dependent oxidoreductase [Bosea caraganae]RDJ28139.1 SDR family NAD(P)-dependent oxidoreductase [Bosea caraganae]